MAFIFHISVWTSYALLLCMVFYFLKRKKEMDACFPLQDGYLCLTKSSHSIKYYYVLHTYTASKKSSHLHISGLDLCSNF